MPRMSPTTSNTISSFNVQSLPWIYLDVVWFQLQYLLMGTCKHAPCILFLFSNMESKYLQYGAQPVSKWVPSLFSTHNSFTVTLQLKLMRSCVGEHMQYVPVQQNALANTQHSNITPTLSSPPAPSFNIHISYPISLWICKHFVFNCWPNGVEHLNGKKIDETYYGRPRSATTNFYCHRN